MARKFSTLWMTRHLRTLKKTLKKRPHKPCTMKKTLKKRPHKPTLKKPPTASTSYIDSFDILENIFSRLPVKSLLRFKSLSKHWYSVISSPYFARCHLSRSISTDHINILEHHPYYSEYKHHLYHSEAHKLWWKNPNNTSKRYTLNFPGAPYRSGGPNYMISSCSCDDLIYKPDDILGSCDGLLLLKRCLSNEMRKNCFCESRNYNMCILNPSTGTRSMFCCKYRIDITKNIYGLCYDAFNDDYKFVLSISDRSYAVYSYKNNHWIEKEDDCIVEICPGSGLFVQGALHWVTYKRSEDRDVQLKQLRGKRHDSTSWNSDHSTSSSDSDDSITYDDEYGICYFDPRDDKFKKLSKPTSVDINFKFRLTNLRGQLCLYRDTINRNECKVIKIWMMKKYGDCNSWIKFMEIKEVKFYSPCVGVEPFCLNYKDKVVLGVHAGKGHGSAVTVYDPKKEGIINGYSGYAAKLVYYESLVLPSRIKL